MRLLAAIFLVVALGAIAGAGIATHYLQELFTFEVALEPPRTREAQRQQLIKGIRTQIEHPDGNGNLSPEDIECLKVKLRELEAGCD